MCLRVQGAYDKGVVYSDCRLCSCDQGGYGKQSPKGQEYTASRGLELEVIRRPSVMAAVD